LRDSILADALPRKLGFGRSGVGAVHAVIVYEVGVEMVPGAPCIPSVPRRGEGIRAYTFGRAHPVGLILSEEI